MTKIYQKSVEIIPKIIQSLEAGKVVALITDMFYIFSLMDLIIKFVKISQVLDKIITYILSLFLMRGTVSFLKKII